MNIFRCLLVILVLLPQLTVAAQHPDTNADPLEAINRPIFALNNTLDRFIIRPVAVGYDVVMPSFAKRGVGNVFSNLGDFNSAVNSVLQGRFGGAGQGAGRFALNSTFGILGLFDVATPMGISPSRTDFGHTLAIWGFESGPYIMVPFLGPRTVRSGAGWVVDVYSSLPTYIDNVPLRNSLRALDITDVRAGLLQADGLITGDRYIFIRDAYLQSRQSLVSDGNDELEDTFSDFEKDGEDWEDF